MKKAACCGGKGAFCGSEVLKIKKEVIPSVVC